MGNVRDTSATRLRYDLVTTQAYPRYAANPPSLPADGRQAWAVGKTLERFFKTRLGIAPKRYAEMAERFGERLLRIASSFLVV